MGEEKEEGRGNPKEETLNKKQKARRGRGGGWAAAGGEQAGEDGTSS